MDPTVIYNGQILTLTRFWATGEPCLWITDPQQIGMPKMEFVGGHPDEYCIFLKNLTEAELAQITSLDGAPLDVKKNETTWNEVNTMESIRNPLPKPPKHMDVDYMTLPDIDTNPLFYDEDAQEILLYWTDGEKVFWGFSPVSRDVEHFVWFNRLFAKDSKHCFLQGKKLRNVDHASFTALNNCYARDCKSVWTTGGRFEPEDIRSFVVCDDGVKLMKIKEIRTMSDGTQRPIRLRIPYGYAKDSKAVYYENFAGKIKILKKADPATFVSNNDGYFAWDAKSIFWGGYLLPKADLQSWRIVNAEKDLSRDDKHFYILNKLVTEEEWNQKLL